MVCYRDAIYAAACLLGRKERPKVKTLISQLDRFAQNLCYQLVVALITSVVL